MAGITPANMQFPSIPPAGAGITPSITNTPIVMANSMPQPNFNQAVAASALQTFQSLLGLSADGTKQKKAPSLAQSYIQGNGSFIVKPLEQGVKVHKSDDSEYWTALGYEA